MQMNRFFLDADNRDVNLPGSTSTLSTFRCIMRLLYSIINYDWKTNMFIEFFYLEKYFFPNLKNSQKYLFENIVVLEKQRR